MDCLWIAQCMEFILSVIMGLSLSGTESASKGVFLFSAKGAGKLANRLNVTRQMISKWEVGDSTPDMEKLIALSDLFEISLDELVLDKIPARAGETSRAAEIISMIVYFGLYGFPK